MLEIQDICRRFTTPDGAVVRALEDVSLTIREHEIISLVGTSGCGKSTLLRLLSGLDHPTEGLVQLDGRTVDKPSPEIGMVFQEPRLLPWLTVTDNVGVALLDTPKTEKAERVAAVLEKVGLTKFADALPRQLSGGMAQRVAIARALVRRPSILLMDEPFSALDSFTKQTLQDHVLDLWRDESFTVVLVTHDLEEAVTLSDRVVVMRGNPGRIDRVVEIDSKRPRDRTSDAVQSLKRDLTAALHLN
ncbi:MAG: ABC transporter ATP-binding protein [Alphaproteobacteria bacterium]|nr:ABC transporter ATP-binding protein [Alphaproteobacteria bacterium]